MEGQEKQIAIITASAADAKALADLFIGHITAHPEYISHGEIQMGVGVGAVQGDRFITCPAPDARERWMKYILSEMSNDAIAHVWKAVDAQGTLMGFCVADIEGNEDCPFGMVGDVLVNPQCRGQGLGDTLLQTAVSWLRSKGIRDIYLESGKDNHNAHRFFEKRGFIHVSEIYRLTQ
ncbi:MAG: GNAT family N-acetyltransferase [Bacteroidales bacterium]|nr:GNAT family N-acetyltransferase [Bacteroidales bacterium]